MQARGGHACEITLRIRYSDMAIAQRKSRFALRAVNRTIGTSGAIACEGGDAFIIDFARGVRLDGTLLSRFTSFNKVRLRTPIPLELRSIYGTLGAATCTTVGSRVAHSSSGTYRCELVSFTVRLGFT